MKVVLLILVEEILTLVVEGILVVEQNHLRQIQEQNLLLRQNHLLMQGLRKLHLLVMKDFKFNI
jgi:hypothetical protein